MNTNTLTIEAYNNSYCTKKFIVSNSSKSIDMTLSSKILFDDVSRSISKIITKKYSTSFSLGILCLDKSIRNAIYQIYGFVRVADEIVDSFHGYEQKEMLDEFELDTFKSIQRKISTHPVLNSFQSVVNQYQIDKKLIESFLYSMRMDLDKKNYDTTNYEKYIYGSAEVVGLMCLQVFVNGNRAEYERLKPAAMKLGSAFQKINFLRDLKADAYELGRVYFPSVDLTHFDENTKNRLLIEIDTEFNEAYLGIKQLPKVAQFGVYVAYIYYRELAKVIRKMSAKELLTKRASVKNYKKFYLLVKSLFLKKIGLVL